MPKLSYVARRSFNRVAFLFLIGIVGFVAKPASAEWPPPEGADLTDVNNMPDDPSYRNGGDWNLTSFIPSENVDKVSDYENSIGAGIHADRAWQLNIGNRDVIIAVLDSGIRWGERDLVNKYYLNRGELPVPDAACGVAAGPDPYDVNGDGHFNVQDYTTATGHEQPLIATICDPRVNDMNGNPILDPQDLILTFSDDTDDDNNGWVDDISGWDIFDDDNDPNDDTDFGHGSGEARDSAAEADNGISSPGVCPECSILMGRRGHPGSAGLDQRHSGDDRRDRVRMGARRGNGRVRRRRGQLPRESARIGQPHDLCARQYVQPNQPRGVGHVPGIQQLHELRAAAAAVHARHVVLVRGGWQDIGHRRIDVLGRPGRRHHPARRHLSRHRPVPSPCALVRGDQAAAIDDGRRHLRSGRCDGSGEVPNVHRMGEPLRLRAHQRAQRPR
jgi:hypothetical protein